MSPKPCPLCGSAGEFKAGFPHRHEEYCGCAWRLCPMWQSTGWLIREVWDALPRYCDPDMEPEGSATWSAEIRLTKETDHETE